MAWRPDDCKSVLKYKQKDKCQESYVARDRVDIREKHKPGRDGNTETHFYECQLEVPQANSCLSSADIPKSLRH